MSTPSSQKHQGTIQSGREQNAPTPGIFSFFAGAGFLDLGFEKSGFEIMYVNEIHRPFLDAYRFARQRIGIAEPTMGCHAEDIRNLLNEREKSELQNQIRTIRSEKRLVGFIGGPPCPDFSVGGKNMGRHGRHGSLSGVYADLIAQQQPDFFLFENVKGLWRTRAHRGFYEEIKRNLRSVGYMLAERLINSIEYGAPQDRDRIILVGFLRKTFKHIPPSKLDEFPWCRYANYEKDKAFSSIWPTTDKFEEGASRRMPKGVVKELSIGYWFKANDVEHHPNASDCFIPRAGLIRFKSVPEGDVSKKSYKRLHRWRYSPTAAYGNNEVHLHPYKARRISAAEALAIQSLPAAFVLPPEMSLSNKFKAIGNGVPFLAAKAIASSIRDFLAELV